MPFSPNPHSPRLHLLSSLLAAHQGVVTVIWKCHLQTLGYSSGWWSESSKTLDPGGGGGGSKEPSRLLEGSELLLVENLINMFETHQVFVSNALSKDFCGDAAEAASLKAGAL